MTISLQKVEASLADMRSDYNRAEGRLEALQDDKKTTITSLAAAKTDIGIWQQVQVLFSEASEFARVQLKARIEETVSAALQAVFEDDSEFRIHMRTLGGSPAAEWQLVSSKGEAGIRVVSDTEDGDGGGASDVVSLALRAALLELSRPRPEGPFILDEPGKMIDKIARPNTAQFVKQYLSRTGRQGLMVTHHDELEETADLAYRVTQVDGISEVIKL